jgi:transglutaminase-like putative cysteine protease
MNPRQETSSERSLINSGGALPWTLIGSALAAMAALYFSSNRFAGLGVLAVLLVFSRFTSWRLPRSIVITYGVRGLILVVLVTAMNRTDPQDLTPWYLKQADTNLAGFALAADIVLRAWGKRDAAGAREGLGVVVLMTGLLFAAATNTYERVHIQVIAPIYAALLLLSLRSFALMQQPTGRMREVRGGLVLLRVVVISLTLLFAGGAVYGVTQYESQVENWAMQFVQRHHNSTQHEIGFATATQLSTVFNPEESIDRVFVIDGQIKDPHLRIASFYFYQSQQWFPLIADRAYAPTSQSGSFAKGGKNVLTFHRLADTTDLLATPVTAAAVGSEDPLEEDGSATIRDTRSGSFAPYQVIDSGLPNPAKLNFEKLSAKSRGQLLAIPSEMDPQVSEIAKRAAGDGKPARQLMRIVKYLQEHHAYSLSYDPHGAEPLNDFILHGRAAHCQYFASAMVVMARAVGIPARYVGGFYAHEPYGNGQTVVRQRDAHAWAECWLDGVGWVTVDATPAGGRPDVLAPRVPSWRRWWEKLNDVPGEIREWIWANARLLKKLAALAAIVALCVWVVRRARDWRRKGGKSAPRYPLPAEEIIEMAQRYEAWLKDRQIACPPERTWRANLAARDSKSEGHWPWGEEAILCDTFMRAYDRARFGSDGEAILRARDILEQIERRA